MISKTSENLLPDLPVTTATGIVLPFPLEESVKWSRINVGYSEIGSPLSRTIKNA